MIKTSNMLNNSLSAHPKVNPSVELIPLLPHSDKFSSLEPTPWNSEPELDSYNKTNNKIFC